MRLWLTMGLIGGALVAHANVNVLVNGGFEFREQDALHGWSNAPGAQFDTSYYRRGGASLRLESDGGSHYITAQLNPELEPGASYVLRYWVDAHRVTGHNQRYVRMRWVRFNPTEIQDMGHMNAWSYPRRTAEWIMVEKELHVPDDYQGGRLDVLWQMNEGDVAWIDDISLTRMGEYGSATQLLLLPNVEQAAVDGRGVVVLEARVADRWGNPVRDYEGTVEFRHRGPGHFWGDTDAPIVNGRAHVHFKGGGNPGDMAQLAARTGPWTGLASVQMIRPSAAVTEEVFSYGLFEDGNLVWDPDTFARMIKEIQVKSPNFNWLILTNTGLDRTTPLLDVAYEHGMNLMKYPARDIDFNWFKNGDRPVTLEAAKAMARPVVEAWAHHPALRAYYSYDEPRWDIMEHAALLTRAFQNLDPARPTAPVLNNGPRSFQMFDGVQSDMLFIDTYPVRGNTTVGSWVNTFARSVQSQRRTLPAGYPLWMILQTHGSENPGWTGAAARTPEPTEVRAQHWIALGEGAKNVSWFIFKTQQWWTGIRDNAPLWDEIGDLADRLTAKRAILPRLHRIEDRFEAESDGPYPYRATHRHDDGDIYVIIQNGDARAPRALTVSSAHHRGGYFLNVEKPDEIILFGDPITLRAGDGALLRYFP